MAHRMATKQRRSRVIGYFSDIIGELKKVVWLSRRETAYLTVLVLIVAGLAGVFLGLIDYGFTNLIDRVFLGR